MNRILLVIALVLIPNLSQANLLDIIKGHAKDIQARFSEDQIISGETIRAGDIDTSAKGQDLLHSSSGTWSVVKVGTELYLQSAENFSSSPGPDYHVYISRLPAIKDNEEFNDQQIEVARLSKPNGAAYYKLTTTNPDDVRSVLIWCKQFEEYIGSADLKKVQ